MENKIRLRAVKFGNFIVNNNTTIRKTAAYFGTSKSTVHKDTQRLRSIDYNLYLKVQEILITNFINKHIAGGAATKAKYLNKEIS